MEIERLHPHDRMRYEIGDLFDKFYRRSESDGKVPEGMTHEEYFYKLLPYMMEIKRGAPFSDGCVEMLGVAGIEMLLEMNMVARRFTN